MPTYEYRCKKGHEFEVFQKMSDEPKARCPTCGAKAERLLSAGAGFLFKGGGFYITDYRSDTYQKAAKAESEKASSTSGGEGSSGSGEKASDAKKAKDAPKAAGAAKKPKSKGSSD